MSSEAVPTRTFARHCPIFVGVFLFATLSSSVKLSYGSGLRLGSAAILATAAIGTLLHLESNQLKGLSLLLMVIVCLAALLASRLELQREGIIRIGCDPRYFALQIEDEGSVEETHPGFIPRSIMTRTTALGGQVQVPPSERAGTAISIKITA